MKAFLVLALFAIAYSNILKESIEHAKKYASTWYPVESEEDSIFYGMTDDQIKSRLNARFTPKFKVRYVQNKLEQASFDSRTAFPGCVGAVRNQGSCGSCWAFATTEAFADRICISTANKIIDVLAAQDLVSCEKNCYGCDGGLEAYAWKWMIKNGVVNETTYPYVSGTTKNSEKCVSYPNALHYHVKAGSVVDEDTAETIADLQKEIMANGPITTGFSVYDDFMSYKGGIYVKTSTKYLGGHAVKIIGWGQENGMDFWIVQNSWGPTWGESGFFRIKMGQCEFEDHYAWGKYQQ
jgi:cathepsin B